MLLKQRRHGYFHLIYNGVNSIVESAIDAAFIHAMSINTKRKRPKRRHQTSPNSRGRWANGPRLTIQVVTATFALQAKATTERVTPIDTDSYAIGVDNRCSACISGFMDDFIGEVQSCDRAIKGFLGATTTSVQRGTIVWKWYDDQGRIHKFHIPNSY